MLPHWTRTRMKAAIPDYKQGVFPPCFGRTFQEQLDLKRPYCFEGSNAGFKTRLRTTCLPSVNVLLLPPFRFLNPTF